jgi:hypothetical protein
MFLETIALDAAMTVSAVRARLARYGLWTDPHELEAGAWIAETAKRFGLSFDETAKRLSRDPTKFGAAIRRQWYASVLWYARTARDVLDECANRAPDEPLLNALSLHEHESGHPLPVPAAWEVARSAGLVLDGSTPLAMSVPDVSIGGTLGLPISAGGTALATPATPDTPATPATPSPPTEIRAWPRLEAPDYSPALSEFEIIVGLSAEQQPHVLARRMIIPVPAGATTVDVTVELTADGLDAPEGWTRILKINPKDPTAAYVTFKLVGRDPTGPEPVHLTMLEVRYLREGSICGTASRPLAIGRATAAALAAAPHGFGTPWLAQPMVVAPLNFTVGDPAADLLIELAKPDRNDTNGRYVCRLASPHPVRLDAGPHEIDLGQDARTFAKSVVVEQVRQYGGSKLIGHVLKSIGRLVADRLPAAVFEAVREVAKCVAPNPPTVLFVSDEPSVPWELAVIDPPLDSTRPPFLGAQTVMGRWWRSHTSSSTLSTVCAPEVLRIDRPPARPPTAISVREMAVMVGMYKAESGLKKLPAAEDEAAALAKSYDAVPLAASVEGLCQLLEKKLQHGSKRIGAVEAVHFAGHGQFDPSAPDPATLYLSDGWPLTSLVFRDANYGGSEHPLFFLNACMLGIGAQTLGDMAGFPGNCLRGGFGGVVGALWEVDDVIAGQIALEFWRRVLPMNGAEGEPIGAVLRDLRGRFSDPAGGTPIPTYLSYVYYGHPRLKLRRQ